uniref:Putative effector protein n=1 Tax=Heterodera avenae TaxID=34510 RepID=A0A2L0VDN6_HETAV|nr:putative effector protein [Heterodera avenae]
MHFTTFILLTFCCLAPIFIFGLAPEIPDKFLHSWSVDHSENFDEYLEAKGYGWFMRQVVKLASITKTFSKNADGTYACKIDTSKKDVEWPSFKLGEEFHAEYMDDSKHYVTFNYYPATDELTETHKKEATDEHPDNYKYTIDSAGFLVMEMEYNGVKTKRYYKKNA